MKVTFLMLLMVIYGCNRDVVDKNGMIHQVDKDFKIPYNWKLSEKIGDDYFIIIDTDGKKWLFKQNSTYYNSIIVTFSKME